MKFSIVIPVYNVERYIDRCLNSIVNQSYKNFEVIVVNDESPDNSQEIIDKYTKMDNRFTSYLKKNGGLSDARNYGAEYATGDYLIFVDSDDYIEKDLLLKLSQCPKENDLIRYKLNMVDEKGTLIKRSEGLNGSKQINFVQLISEVDFFENAWIYAYSLKFWQENNFKYEFGKIHEDFGLTPLCAILAKNIYFLDYYGYNYVQREGSIMNGAEKNNKRVYDILYHFDNLIKQIEEKDVENNDKKFFSSYLANGAISVARLLDKEELEKYIKCLKERQIYKYLLDDTLSRKIKKAIIKANVGFYIKRRYK